MQATQTKPAIKGPAPTQFAIRGMTCGNCARHVTEAIQSVTGVRNAIVSLQNENAVVRWNSGSAENVPAIIRAVASAGYEAEEMMAGEHGTAHHHETRWQWPLILGVFVTATLMIGEWAFNFGMVTWFQWFSLFLAAGVQIFSGAQFYRGAWNQLKIGGSNMDTLVALGSTTAFGYSAWALLSGAGGHLYFMEAAAIITLISGGHWIESRVSEKASTALKSLLNLAPQTARRKNPDGNEIEISIAKLKIGDEIILRPGDHAPIDGIIIEGASAVDESSLTGESVPVEKKTGNELFSGTINLNGHLVVRVTATGDETALSNIIAAVQRAQTSRADIQRLADRVSNIFVPVVVAIAIAAGLWWGLAPESARHFHDLLAQFLWHARAPAGVAAGFIIAAAILIIACPCAMGLATPAAIMAGANAASRRGILVRDGIALEKAGKISAIVFDKTGTLTEGKPKVAESWQITAGFQPVSDSKEEMETGKMPVLQLAASLAKLSTHPISQAISKLSDEKVGLGNWKEIRGAGVEAQVSNSKIVRLGSLRWLKEMGVDFSSGEEFISEWSNQGATIVGVAEEKKLLGLFGVRDAVKTNAANVVKQLQQQNLKIFLVTGDNSLTAASIAKQVGIAEENVFPEVRPEQKAEFVKKLQSQDERVAFVGDGINDAPALTQADLGIAVSRASDIARAAADIILLKSEIEAVPESLELARATLRTIKQNLFWAFFYNAIGIPLAAFGFISPIFCAAAMGFSDLIVICNALRLSRWRHND